MALSPARNKERAVELLPSYLKDKKVKPQVMKNISEINGINGYKVKLIITRYSIIKGCSGGPLLTYDARVVGVISGIIEKQNISLSVPLQTVREFIK